MTTYNSLNRLMVAHSNTEDDTLIRIRTIYDEEKTLLLRNKIKKIINQEYQLEQYGAMYTDIKLMIKNNKSKLLKQTAKEHKNGYLWCTINPKPEMKFQEFRKYIEKMVKYSCFKEYTYAFEQRGTEKEKNIGKGFHCHLIFKRNLAYKPSDLIKKIKRSAGKIVGNINNNNQLNFATIGEEYAKDKYTYINGLKKAEKTEKQMGDITFRKKEKILKIYTNIKI